VSTRCRLYGLTLQTALAIPGGVAAPRATADVTFTSGSAADFAAARRRAASSAASTWFRSSCLADGSRYLCWSGLFEFVVSPGGRRVIYRRLEHATDESFTVYLLGQVLSYALVARGIEPLHGTVVVVDGEAVGLLGDCGLGKSTLAAALLQRGCRVLTDDLIVVKRRRRAWVVEPGIPRLKLFPSVARALLDRRGGTPMNNGTSKLVLPLARAQSVGRPVPLKALYLLERPTAASRRSTRIERIAGADALLEVIRATFNLVVRSPTRFANQFGFASELAADVPVKRLAYPRTLRTLPEVCRALLADVRTPERQPRSAPGRRTRRV
jgi:hypothetical protein